MRATVNRISSNKVKIDFEVETKKFEEGMQKAYRKNVGKFNIPGFRKGKAPRKVIELHYGESVFFEDAIDTIFPEIYSAAINENKLDIVGQPEIEWGDIGGGKPLTFSLEVYVKPEITLGDYKGLTAQKRVTPVTDADVDAEIERVRESVSTYIDVTDRPVRRGDQVTMNYSGTIDGKPFEGGSAEEYSLIIGSGEFLPEFEDQLIGAEISRELDISVTFPEDYANEAVRGKPALFKVKVTAIHEKELPELDDEFAKDVSECETFAEYTAQIREKLEKAARENDLIDFKSRVLEAAAANALIDIPPPMIEDRIDKRIQDFEMHLMYRGISIKNYLKTTRQEIEDIREKLREEAEQDVRIMLVIEAIGETEQIEPTEQDIDAEITKYVERTHDDFEKYKASMTEDRAAYFKYLAKHEKTLSFLADSAIPIKNSEVLE